MRSFLSITTAACRHEAVVSGGNFPYDLSEFRWINILHGNLQIVISGAFQAFDFDKYAKRYFGGFCFRFVRRFKMKTKTNRLSMRSVAASLAQNGG